MSKKSKRYFFCFELGTKHGARGIKRKKLSRCIEKNPYNRGYKTGEHIREFRLWRELRLGRYSP